MSTLKDGLFNAVDIQSDDSNGEADSEAADADAEVQELTKRYEDRGFEQAGNMRGSSEGLAICLNRIYQEYKSEVRKDRSAQEESRKPLRKKIQKHRGKIDKLQSRIRAIREEKLPTAKNKIEAIQQEKREIRQNPEQVIEEAAGKASFYIGTAILVCLSVYLFVFYSSASYSAFFKKFTPGELGVVNSIFHAQALAKAYSDGVTELILLLTMPFVFMGLGFLIHKFQQSKNRFWYLKVAVLVLVTFIFDCILAYKITRKINLLTERRGFEVPDYSISEAVIEPNFWLIIFAGFMVYIIWGFVYDFVIDEHEKLDAVSRAIRLKQEEAEEAKDKKQNLEEQAHDLEHEVTEHQAEINRLQDALDNLVFIPKQFKRRTSAFMVGWISWMRSNRHPDRAVEEAKQINENFLQNVRSQAEKRTQQDVA